MCTPHAVEMALPMEAKQIGGGEIPPIHRFNGRTGECFGEHRVISLF